MAKKFITCDGNTAVATIAYLFSEHAASPMKGAYLQYGDE